MKFFLPSKRLLDSLLEAIVSGDQNKAIHILKTYPEAMVAQACVKDKSGRIFKKASAVEMVWWNGDLHYMANAMLDILEGLKDKELAKYIRDSWIAQYKANEEEGGLEFEFMRKLDRCKTFRPTLLLIELQAYIGNFDKMDWEQRIGHWCDKVGAEQYLLTPIYVQAYYCNPSSADSLFDKEPLQRVIKYQDQSHPGRSIAKEWWNREKGFTLGKDFAVYRDHHGVPLKAQAISEITGGGMIIPVYMNNVVRPAENEANSSSTFKFSAELCRDNLSKLQEVEKSIEEHRALFLHRLNNSLKKDLVLEEKPSFQSG
jgi:hypothetical protein